MNKNRNVIMGAIPMVVSAIAAGANVRVIWGRYQTASTDGKVIHMPFLPLEDEKVEAYALGFAVHETGHIVGTEFGLPMGSGLRASLVNILEDVRIEAERMDTLPGARRWLENLAYVLLQDGKLGGSAEDWPVSEKLCSYLLTHLWVEILQFNGLRDAAMHGREILARALPAELFGAVEAKALSVKNATSTRDVMALADEIVALLQEQQQAAEQAAQQPEPPPEPRPDPEGDQDQAGGAGGSEDSASDESRGDSADDGAESEGDEAAEDEAEQEAQEDAQGDAEGGTDQGAGDGAESQGGDETPGEGEHEAEPGDEGGSASGGSGDAGDEGEASGGSDAAASPSGDGAGTEAQTASGAGDGDHSSGMTAREVADTLQQLLDATEIEAGKDIGERIAEGLGQSLQAASPPAGEKRAFAPMAAPDVAEMRSVTSASALIGQVRQQSMALRARLDEYVQAQTRRRSTVARSGSRLVRNVAGKLAMKDYRIYSVERSEVKKVDTAIALLIDCSGSMVGERIKVAREAAVALSVALEDIKGVQLSVLGFGTADALVTRVVRFGEGLRQTAGRIGSLTAENSTPLAEGLLVAHTDLLSVTAERRIAMVVTDGDPNDVRAVLDVARFGRRHGIEHMGIGIQKETGHLFPASCTINQVGELPRAVLDMIQRVLFDNRLAA